VPFLYDDHLGHVTVCPSDLGTSLKITCVINLPVLGKNPDAMVDAVSELKLEIISVPSPYEPELVLFEVSN
jgi:protein-arginine kinase